jgi:hypothetical protein
VACRRARSSPRRNSSWTFGAFQSMREKSGITRLAVVYGPRVVGTGPVARGEWRRGHRLCGHVYRSQVDSRPIGFFRPFSPGCGRTRGSSKLGIQSRVLAMKRPIHRGPVSSWPSRCRSMLSGCGSRPMLTLALDSVASTP